MKHWVDCSLKEIPARALADPRNGYFILRM